MTSVTPFVESKEINHRRLILARDEGQSELDRMNNLNSRFMNFLDLVKLETKRSDTLKSMLLDSKQEIVGNLRENSSKYQEDLLMMKKFLNDVTYSLNSCQVNERSNRIKIEWFSKLLKFELDNLNQKPKFNIALVNNLTLNCPMNQSYDSNSNDFENQHNYSLSSNSMMTSSQTSLSSMSCASSESSQNISEGELSHLASSTVVIGHSPIYISDTQLQLENYLSNTKYLRNQLESDYEKKVTKIFESKEHVSKLNTTLDDLNNNLDTVRTSNCNLHENVKNLKKELEFYKRLNSTNQNSLCLDYVSTSGSKGVYKKDDAWFNKELDRVRKEAIEEFELFNKNELNVYEEYLENELLSQLEEHEKEFHAEADRIELESDSILNELTELNQQLQQSSIEYDIVSKENQILTERLISLSNNLCSFSELSENDQDCLIINFSIKTLERQIASTKADIKTRKKDLALVRNSLTQKDIIELLEPNEQCLINPKTNPWLNLNTLNPSSLILKQHYSEQKTHHEQTVNTNKSQEYKYELNIRPYNSQIEYTKSNLFAYLKLDFDLTRNYFNSNSKQSNKLHNTNLNCLHIAVDSIDGHSIVLENSHKILDFDLSEWTLRREIQNCPNLDMFNSSDRVTVPFKIPVEGDVKLMPESDNPNENLVKIIEFKFPKGFKLKRRKKVNLIASGFTTSITSNSSQKTTTPIDNSNSFSCNSLNEVLNTKKTRTSSNRYSSSTNLAQNNSSPSQNVTSITMNKCACCSCKLLTTRQGDIDIFEVKEVANWGTGLLVVTKFINNKNITKLVNYKCLKHIWVNDSVNKNRDESNLVGNTILEELGL